MAPTVSVVKGHGTENDFVLVPDLDGLLDLTPRLVRALCDRHAGIGADGVLRVVRTELMSDEPDFKEMAAEAPYFMDYRNADGSIASMCGNGVRVFVRYLRAVGLVDHSAAVATRGGVRRTWLTDEGDVIVDMGMPLALADRPVVTAASSVDHLAGVVVEMPNPHVVVRAAERHLVMRVHERGVGETRSCGTGICAVVVAAALADGAAGGDGTTWRVDVPGGSCHVTWRSDGSIHMTGPAVLVAEIELDAAWLAAVG